MNEILKKRKSQMLIKLKKLKKKQLNNLYKEKNYWNKKKHCSYMKRDVRLKISNCKKVLESINTNILRTSC